MSTYFITGSHTGIGKTYVTTKLIEALTQSALPVQALKPVISGFHLAEASASDTGAILNALSLPITPTSIAACSPWRYEAPLAPDMAARQLGQPLDLNAVIQFCLTQAKSFHGTTFVEGVGGVMCPMTEYQTVLDWIKGLGWPAIVVTGTYLGSMNHTLCTIRALESIGAPVKMIIVNESIDATVGFDETMLSLKQQLPAYTLMPLRWGQSLQELGQFLKF